MDLNPSTSLTDVLSIEVRADKEGRRTNVSHFLGKVDITVGELWGAEKDHM